MKEFINKLIGRLEELKAEAFDKWDGGASHRAYSKSIEIVNELAEEYINTSSDISSDISTTNADRIRSMTDEELAEFFDKLETVCDMCACNIGCCNVASKNCKTGFLEWLQSEVEGVTENE